MWSGFPLGRIKTGLYADGNTEFQFGTCCSKLVGLIALMIFIAMTVYNLSKFGNGVTYNQQQERFKT